VPRKNIRPLNGRPLLAYTVDQARGVAELDLTVVSTEDPEIRAVALELGVRVIDRPVALATDSSPTEAALRHALETLSTQEEPAFDYVVVLEPTSPLRSSATIHNCVQTIVDRSAVSLLGVRETRENIGTLDHGFFRPLRTDAPRRRQDRKPFYIESSTVYVCRVEHLMTTGSLVTEDWCAYVVPDHESVDINTLEDFALAECLIRMRKETQ